MKHSPGGAWRVLAAPGRLPVIVNEEGLVIVERVFNGNEHILAAAPDLAAALLSLLETAQPFSTEDWERIEGAVAALEKAGVPLPPAFPGKRKAKQP